ncbi:MAG: hypothetical protein P1V20_28025 [Verrucomicrobiales bacterium]|nr:hypothetical protein [Verrucomicrobiales bacterium]
MIPFDPDQPAAGAQRLIRWVEDSFSLRDGGLMPPEWTTETIEPFLEKTDAFPPAFRWALHFGIAAAASESPTAIDEPVWKILDQSIRRLSGIYVERNDGLSHALISLGILWVPKTTRWLRSDSFDELAIYHIQEKLTEWSHAPALEAWTDYLLTLSDHENQLRFVRSLVSGESADLALRILEALPSHLRTSDLGTDLFRFGMSKQSAELQSRFVDLFPAGEDTDAVTEREAIRIQELVEAGKLDEASEAIDHAGGTSWRFTVPGSRLAHALMMEERWEEGLNYYKQYGGCLSYSIEQGREWFRQWAEEESLAIAIARGKRLPNEECATSLAMVAEELLASGEFEALETVLDEIENPVQKAQSLLALLRLARQRDCDPKKRQQWLATLESHLPKSPKDSSRYFDFSEGAEFFREKIAIEAWHLGRTETFETFQKERQAELAANSEDSDELAGSLARAFAETLQLEPLCQLIDEYGGREDFRGDVLSSVLNEYTGEDQIEALLGCLLDLPADEENDDDDEDFWEREMFLRGWVISLAEQRNTMAAERIAIALRDQFDSEDGFTALADAGWRVGDYQSARRWGGASGRVHAWRKPDRSRFPLFVSDPATVESVTSVSEWESSETWLARYGAAGHPAAALTYLLQLFFRRTQNRSFWKTNEESYIASSRDLVAEAREQAKYRVWQEGKGPAPRTPWDITITLIGLEACSLIYNLITGGALHREEKKIERQLERNVQEIENSIRRDLPAVVALPAGDDRLRQLAELAERVREEFEPPDRLRTALREESQRLNSAASNDDNLTARETLAVALMRVGDFPGACENWRQVSARQSPPLHRIEDLIHNVPRESWHLAAPLCRYSPKAAMTLAAKLALWYPKEKIRLPGE